MRTTVNPIIPNREQPDWSSKYMGRENQSNGSFLSWWYRISAPPVPPPTAPLREREVARRGRLTSIVLLIFIVLIAGVGIPARALQDPPEALPLIVLTIPLFLAVWLNRRGNVNVSGFIVVSALTTALSLVLTVFQSHGLTTDTIVLFDLTIQTELFAVSLLPAPAVFVAAAYNCTFIILDYMLLPHAPDLVAMAAHDGIDVIVRPIALDLTVALITFLWVRSATGAIKRADRAEVIAKLEHDLAQQAQIVVSQKRRLDSSIRQIVQTHMQVANGDLNARVPLTQENVLWEVAGALNNLLSRFQRARQAESKLEELQARLRWAHQVEHQLRQLQQEQARAMEEVRKQVLMLRKAKSSQGQVVFKPTRTMLDPLLAELNGKYIVSNQPPREF